MPKLQVTTNRKETKPILAALVILPFLLLAAFPGCQASEATPSHLKVVTFPYISFATFYIAQEEGYFAEQGLEVEFVKFSATPQVIPLLAQGSLDVAAGPLSASFINAVAQNANLKIVAGRESAPSDCESSALMARSDLYESGELDTVTEVKGRKVTISSTATISDFTLSKILETAGLTTDDVEIVKMPVQNNYAAFENRAIDAATLGTPHIQRIKALGAAVTLDSLNRLMPDYQYGFITFGPSLLDNPELGKRFLVAYLQGVRQYRQGKTKRNLEILEKHLGLDEEALRQACWSTIHPDARIKVEDILVFQDWLYENGFVDEKLTREQLIDTSFLEHANEVLGPE